MQEINGYRILGELSARNAGFCQWGFCEKDGREYFIKEFLAPVYPEDQGDLSPKVIARKRKLCENFFAARQAFYDVLRSCRSGNIILVEDFFRWGSKYYAVSDKVETEGTDPGLIAQLPEEKKETLLRAILYSMAKLHRAGIVHADIKPDNILLKRTVDGFYTAKIIDFDAGFLRGQAPEEVQGDFLYLAPEGYLKMNGEPVELTEKIDIFALGILFHRYWTGILPTLRFDYRYAFEAVLDGSEVQLSESIPAGLRGILGRMLDRDPARRPSAEEILTTLRSGVSGGIPGTAPMPVGSGFYVPGDLN